VRLFGTYKYTNARKICLAGVKQTAKRREERVVHGRLTIQFRLQPLEQSLVSLPTPIIHHSNIHERKLTLPLHHLLPTELLGSSPRGAFEGRGKREGRDERGERDVFVTVEGEGGLSEGETSEVVREERERSVSTKRRREEG